jgi:putative acetyltransferase
MLQIVYAETTNDIEKARRLFREYAAELNVDLCFQSFEQELAELPGPYANPDGRLLLGTWDGKLAGCVALKKLDGDICEMKRLYVRPEYRGKRIGRALAEAILNEARLIGYTRMRLDTLERLKPAIVLYESLGFQRIEPYYHNPMEGVAYMELDLLGEAHSRRT